MYLDYFKLKEFPFCLVSDPRYLFLTKNHQKVNAYLEYAMNVQDSFVVITGEIGTGKTTLINNVLDNAEPNNILITIQATKLNSLEFLQSLLLEIGLVVEPLNKVTMLNECRRYLVQRQNSRKKVFLIIDEAQNLEKEVLEHILYLSNLERRQQKLLNIVMVAQPYLNSSLDDSGMEHFLQRVRLRTHINALDLIDVEPYIKHRLSIAGATETDLFSQEAYNDIYQFTGGRLRLINILCDYALMVCYVEKLPQVDSWVVQVAANELQWQTYEKRFGRHENATKFRENNDAKPGEAKLQLRQGGRVVGEYSLQKGELTIGRQDNNDIQLNSHKVSRKHAQILSQSNNYYLHDLSSTNGTLVNDDRISIHILQHGQSFSISDYQFIFYAPVVVAEIVSEVIAETAVLDNQCIENTRILLKKNDTRKYADVADIVD